MLYKMLRAECDHCKVTATINTGDSLEADRILVRRKWSTPILSYYGGVGHYCPNEACQRKAEEVRYKGND